MIDILSLREDELIELVEKLGEKKYRAKQLFHWLHKEKEIDFNKMTNLSKSFIEQLNKETYINSLNVNLHLVSKIDGTNKFLLELFDGEVIECVLMKYKFGYSICISTQAGCKMGCTFCASTKAGFKRNLTVSEMLQQIYTVEKETGVTVSNVVLMGIGEPFDNYDNVMNFINIINNPNGHNIGARHITISTCGIVDKIIDFSDRKLQVSLAISLHNPFSSERNDIMPINKKYDIDELVTALKYYTKKTNRRVTIEYALINGQNDTLHHAKKMVEYFKNGNFHINLIPVNKIKEFKYNKSTQNSIDIFKKYISDNKIPVTVRRTIGSDINAACGQLRRNYKEN